MGPTSSVILLLFIDIEIRDFLPERLSEKISILFSHCSVSREWSSATFVLQSISQGSPGLSEIASSFFFNLEYLFLKCSFELFFNFKWKICFVTTHCWFFKITALMVQELKRMAYFFHLSSGINQPWMLLTLKRHREGSGTVLSSRENFLEYSILC